VEWVLTDECAEKSADLERRPLDRAGDRRVAAVSGNMVSLQLAGAEVLKIGWRGDRCA
jgi:hypothetical protein